MSKKSRILLLTGRMAQDDVRRSVEAFDNVYVDVLPISVAAFTTTRLVLRHGLEFISKHDPDVIIISGMAQGDFTQVGRELRTRVLKGTRNVSGLPLLLRGFEDFAHLLSPIESADIIIKEKQKENLHQYIQELEDKVSFKTRNFKLISGIPIGLDFPPKVMAEVVDVTTRSIDESLEKAKKFVEWADIIDLGTNIEKTDPEKIAELVTEVKKLGLPVSIDTLNPSEILAGVDAGAEIVLSVDHGNIGVVQRLPEDVAIVCLPTNVSEGVFPNEPSERARLCKEICEKLEKKGYTKLFADPLMEAAIHPGLMKSLTAYYMCRQLDSDRPFLAGFGNVTEFIDSDTTGVNALLACLGIELGISVFLTTEERASTVYSTKELHLASQMSFAAKILNAPPRDIGFSAFYIKSPQFDPQTLSDNDSFEVVMKETSKHQTDPKGCFRIAVDRRRRRILCQHKKSDNSTINLKSETANALLQAILTRGIISHLSHASYLGCELTKAEICMKSGRNYVQDEIWDST